MTGDAALAGFARVVCPSCQYEILVPFSCKVRGLCPSCDGRRMAAGAADLVDHILPVVADYRQWTLSFPRWLRIRLLRDKALVSEVLLVFVRVVSAYHRRRARRGRPDRRCHRDPTRGLVRQRQPAF